MRSPTNRHYDQDPAIFALFLGESLKYSEGIYERGDESLDEAQRANMRFASECMQLTSGARLLEVGCGWGGFATFAAKELGCIVTAITPAPLQAKWVSERASRESCEIELEVGRFEEIELPLATFDAVSFVGSIVHLPEKAAVIRKARSLLRPSGRLYIAESCYKNERTFARNLALPGSVYVAEGIFGGGEMVPLSTYVAAIEDAGFSLKGLRDLTSHYAKTIEQWKSNVHASAMAIDALKTGLSADLVRYLDIANAGWGLATKHYAIVAENSR